MQRTGKKKGTAPLGAQRAPKRAPKRAAKRAAKRAPPQRLQRDQTPPPSRAKGTGGREAYERNAFVQFAKAYMLGERTAGRGIGFQQALVEASLLWTKKHEYKRQSSTSSFRKKTSGSDEHEDSDDEDDHDDGDDSDDGDS